MEPVSIILKVWNALDHVEYCLSNILNNSDSDFELILVDNASNPNVASYLDSLANSDARINLIRNSTNLGPARANIQGFAAATNNLVCLIDSDVLVSQGWLSKLTRDLLAFPSIKLLAPIKYDESIPYPLDPKKNSREAWFKIKDSFTSASPKEQFLAYSNGLNIDDFEKIICGQVKKRLNVLDSPPGFFSSCCVIGYKDFIGESGGIADPGFYDYGSEDVDLCWRIGISGGLIAKSNSTYVHHFHRSSLNANRVDVKPLLITANMKLYQKWCETLFEQILERTTSETIEEYLKSHFIFQPLSENTSFIKDLRQRTGWEQIPNQILWRSLHE